MSSFLDKYKKGNPVFLIYYYKGEIKVKEGYVETLYDLPYAVRKFYPKDENKWHTGVPYGFGFVNSKGKILVKHKEDIPKAKQMIREHYTAKIDEVKDRAVASLMNIQNMIKSEV